MSSKTKTDNDELNEILTKPITKEEADSNERKKRAADVIDEAPITPVADEVISGKYVQWSTHGTGVFIPTATSVPKLSPGYYAIRQSDAIGIFFDKRDIKTEKVLRFPDSDSINVVKEIEKFWEREHLFNEYSLAFKRGILLWGPPGSGKTCTIQLIMEDVIQRGGVVLEFCNPYLFNPAFSIYREIEPNTPCVVLMEDIDSILEEYSESNVLNILDGVGHMNKVVFLATTNYPERLGARIVNRPSRFDKRIKINHPNAKSRKMYFEHLFNSGNGTGEKLRQKCNLKQWIKDTDGFSIAHLKELFIAVTIIGDDYSNALSTLKSMKDHLDSKYGDTGMGFTTEEEVLEFDE